MQFAVSTNVNSPYHLWVIWPADPTRDQFQSLSFHRPHTPDQRLFCHHLTCNRKHRLRYWSQYLDKVSTYLHMAVKDVTCHGRSLFIAAMEQLPLLCCMSGTTAFQLLTASISEANLGHGDGNTFHQCTCTCRLQHILKPFSTSTMFKKQTNKQTIIHIKCNVQKQPIIILHFQAKTNKTRLWWCLFLKGSVLGVSS